MFRKFAPLLIVGLAGCVATSAPPQVDALAPGFAPLAFFDGHTEGRGVLRVIASKPRTVHVTGTGRLGPDGALSLVQRIDQEGKQPRTRTWSLKPNRSGGYSSMLSDATGPVLVATDRGRLHIRFRTKGDVRVEQWLVLEPGGRVARNHLVARKFGLRVAVLDETITKID
ncbi:DUF3833 family protein [Sphingomonas sp. GC_Shp_3]|uniref:DUF3833 family protein n=1 Tax=Sphingomonas sp. GC_Shp_3 TaxID=2937383 RepID=UPI00226AE5ED|nr:DUF3833 family protein [Sphingomonas sp. GC_Shp_3]